jgi:copper resistance protein B
VSFFAALIHSRLCWRVAGANRFPLELQARKLPPRRSRILSFIFAAALACFCSGIARAQTSTSQAPPMPMAPGSNAAPANMQMAGMGNDVFAHALFNQLEGRTDGSNSELRWDGEAWIGTDTNRAWFRSEGFASGSAVSDADIEALYDRPLPRLRYFDGQIGLREDVDSLPHRTWLALGIEGLAPGYFQFQPTLYIRDGGHVAGRVTGSYDLLITQRLIAQPEIEMNFYSRRDPARLLGTGLTDLDTGIRVRYEIRRKFAPYLGFAYTRDFGETARLVRQSGQYAAAPRFIFGLRLWY